MRLDGRVIYQLDAASFFDSDGDGLGDLAGITRKLEHIRAVGADTVWLQPFFVSPYLDAGYDIVDHCGVSARYGTMADFEDLLERCHQLDLRLMVELVMQHTSVHHPWFRSARADRSSPYRDHYVWASEPRDDPVVREPVFPGPESSIWEYDERAAQYYRHAFYRHEADLDTGHPAVREEITRVIRHWADAGVDGFRVDAVPYMVRQAALTDDRDDGFWLLEEMAAAAGDAPLMGEVDAEPDQYPRYFGRGDRLHAVLDFWTNNQLFLALTRSDAEPLVRALEDQPAPPDACTYVNWLRNHDELDLALLTDAERAEVMAAFAPQPTMRAFGRGIRRRLAPMLGDTRRVALAHAIVQSLPGAPVIRYGEEIGMADDLNLPDRVAVRTPMQWSDADNGGFSKAPPSLVDPAPVSGGPYGYQTVNVTEQELRPGSLLSLVSDLTNRRRELGDCPSSGCEAVSYEHRAVLGVLHHHAEDSILMLSNLSKAEVDLRLDHEVIGDLLADSPYEPATRGSVRLRGDGYRWLRVRTR